MARASSGAAELVPASRTTLPLRLPAPSTPQSAGLSSQGLSVSGTFFTPGRCGRPASGSGLRGE
jgi:hypothetical protein